VTQAYLLFHLNLAFSSIAESQRPQVIARCYRPLLDLIETHHLPIGIEMTGWTLRQIQQLAPDWVARFRRLLAAGRCELIGSGYVQLIGPLVPHAVNAWNQRLGREDYAALLGQQPSLALVNEMAFASGLVPVYLEAGYRGMVMDRDNVRLALDLLEQPYEAVPSHALGPAGETLPVLWSDSILFQKLQRLAHGEIGLADYLAYFHKRAGSASRPLAAYCNDAEIFDFRPGRFAEESQLQGESEWLRVARLLTHLAAEESVSWLLPSAALAASLAANPVEARTLTSIRQPVPVKKQAKYNLSRWAVSGRNDLWLNTGCHRLLRDISGNTDPTVWRELCEFWASDLRTHLTAERWREVGERLEKRLPAATATETLNFSADYPADWKISQSPDGILLMIATADLHLTLKQRKGLTVHSLAFRSQGFVPVVGTLPHGYFESIDYGADFYTGGVIIELPGEHRRITDLLPVSPRFHASADTLLITARIDSPAGPIDKTLRIARHGERVTLSFAFPGWQRPRGIVRVGTTTLLPEAFAGPLQLRCRNGGQADEIFALDRNCDHGHPSSSLVSSTTGLGASNGELVIGDQHRALRLDWDPADCAALPMLIHQRSAPSHLTRIVFALAELDDTSRPEGALHSFTYNISPVQHDQAESTASHPASVSTS
jgi:hypothetical protein